MSVPASAPIGPRRGGTPRSRALVVTIAIIVTLAVVVSGSAVVLFYSKIPVSSRQVLEVGHGRSSLAVPLMTMYTAPKIPYAQVESSANWSVASTRTGPSTTYLFQWSLSTHLSIPVRFVLNATTEDQNFGAFALGSTADGFFQAEDGIRDYKVTGVQTCALPIWKADRWRAGTFRICPIHHGGK